MNLADGCCKTISPALFGELVRDSALLDLGGVVVGGEVFGCGGEAGGGCGCVVGAACAEVDFDSFAAGGTTRRNSVGIGSGDVCRPFPDAKGLVHCAGSLVGMRLCSWEYAERFGDAAGAASSSQTLEVGLD